MRTVGEIATPFEKDGEAFDDFYVGSTFGLDLNVGYGNGQYDALFFGRLVGCEHVFLY